MTTKGPSSQVVVNVNDCPALRSRPPDGSTVAADPADYADDGSGGFGPGGGSGAARGTAVPYPWRVAAVGAEAEAYAHWDEPGYAAPDQLESFGLWLGDAADRDVDAVKVERKRAPPGRGRGNALVHAKKKR